MSKLTFNICQLRMKTICMNKTCKRFIWSQSLILVLHISMHCIQNIKQKKPTTSNMIQSIIVGGGGGGHSTAGALMNRTFLYGRAWGMQCWARVSFKYYALGSWIVSSTTHGTHDTDSRHPFENKLLIKAVDSMTIIRKEKAFIEDDNTAYI